MIITSGGLGTRLNLINSVRPGSNPAHSTDSNQIYHILINEVRMAYKDVKAWRLQTKSFLVQCLGGKCCRCGYNRCLAGLDFHHIDPAQKDDTLSNYLVRPTATFDIIKEARKCVLLCKLCHCELHAGLWIIDEITLPAFDESYIPWRFGPKQSICPVCLKVFVTKESTTKFCGVACALKGRITRYKVQRPSKDELLELVWTLPTSVVAKRFGVSDKSIEKWCKSYGITKPGPGYWMKNKT